MGMGRAYKLNKKADNFIVSIFSFPFRLPFIILSVIFGSGKKKRRK